MPPPNVSRQLARTLQRRGLPFYQSCSERMTESEREDAARDLAKRLFFAMQKAGEGYSLRRCVEVDVRHDNLTLDEVESILETWKLRGPHGG
jgi:hypothetical protein